MAAPAVCLHRCHCCCRRHQQHHLLHLHPHLLLLPLAAVLLLLLGPEAAGVLRQNLHRPRPLPGEVSHLGASHSGPAGLRSGTALQQASKQGQTESVGRVTTHTTHASRIITDMHQPRPTNASNNPYIQHPPYLSAQPQAACLAPGLTGPRFRALSTPQTEPAQPPPSAAAAAAACLHHCQRPSGLSRSAAAAGCQDLTVQPGRLAAAVVAAVGVGVVGAQLLVMVVLLLGSGAAA